ncbi:MAG: thioredoxin family protein [Beijerinckiaceae bacterium]|nr:thioredoxin family protein [Beijerinckiaceae bacterium]
MFRPSLLSRRHMLAAGLAASALVAAPALAVTLATGFSAYKKETFDAALKGTKPVLVHVHADWCPTCKRQQVVFNELAKTPEFGKLVAFTVDFDMDGEFKATHNVRNQSVILVFKGGKEVARSGGVTDKAQIAALVAEAAK